MPRTGQNTPNVPMLPAVPQHSIIVTENRPNFFFSSYFKPHTLYRDLGPMICVEGRMMGGGGRGWRWEKINIL